MFIQPNDGVGIKTFQGPWSMDIGPKMAWRFNRIGVTWKQLCRYSRPSPSWCLDKIAYWSVWWANSFEATSLRLSQTITTKLEHKKVVHILIHLEQNVVQLHWLGFDSIDIQILWWKKTHVRIFFSHQHILNG